MLVHWAEFLNGTKNRTSSHEQAPKRKADAYKRILKVQGEVTSVEQAAEWIFTLEFPSMQFYMSRCSIFSTGQKFCPVYISESYMLFLFSLSLDSSYALLLDLFMQSTINSHIVPRLRQPTTCVIRLYYVSILLFLRIEYQTR